MEREKKVTFIPATNRPKKIQRVVIYARESSNSVDQLRALSTQVSKLTQKVASQPDWKLMDTYIDVHSSKVGLGIKREQFSRLRNEAIRGLFDIVICSSVTRFGRNTEEIIESLRNLRANDVRVIFVDDGFDSFKVDDTLIIELYAAFAQDNNENRSAAIKWGNEKRAEQGTSKFYDRPTYGYKKNSEGKLEIIPEQAEVVKQIFSYYISGLTPVKIIRELKEQNIVSPKGKEKWCKGTVEKILVNEKYAGRVILGKDDDYTPSYEYKDHHEKIISEETFSAAQLAKVNRSNMKNGKRKTTKYSSKKIYQE